MKRLINIFIILLLVSCKNPESYIQFLNGYWEINEVTLPDGSKKIYSFNDNIDYIQISDSLTGIRKKLKPNITGGYESSGITELIKLKIENDSLNVYYSTPYAKWKETVLSASEDEMLVINKAKVRYLYKRYQPLNLNDEQTP